jgi:hypothetical protein
MSRCGWMVYFVVVCVSCSDSPSGGEADSTTVVPDVPAGSWESELSAQSVSSVTIGDTAYNASSRIALSWSAPSEAAAHYIIAATDGVSGTTLTTTVDGATSEAVFEGLKSETAYTFAIRACADADCVQSSEGLATATATTAREVWQLMGTGQDYPDLHQVVESGNVLPHVIQYGDGSGDLEGTVRFYWEAKPFKAQGGGMKAGLATPAGTSSADYSSFTEVAHPIKDLCDSKDTSGCPDGAFKMSAAQAIPLESSAVVRVYFEATTLLEAGKPTRIYAIESVDGYAGLDFNKGDNDVCGENPDDYKAGGDCEVKLVIGVSGDAGVEDSGLSQVRQFKVGLAKPGVWRWDESVGSFMVITGASECAKVVDGLFYARWNGTDWLVDKDDAGCPRVLEPHSHGPVLDYLGGNRYAVYYEARQAKQQDPKPFKVIYSDAAETGEADKFDFDDWESHSNARDVDFLWPDGTLLSDAHESGLGDHFIVRPAKAPTVRYMYMNIGGPDGPAGTKGSKGTGFAVHVNP